MEQQHLTERQRRDLLQVAGFIMVLVILAVNGGRYLSISPTLCVIGVAVSALAWLAIMRREPDPAEIRLDDPPSLRRQ